MLRTAFAFDPWGFLFGCTVFTGTFLWNKRNVKRGDTPALLYSDLALLEGSVKSRRLTYAFLPDFLRKTAFFCFLAALCNPFLKMPKNSDTSDLPKKKETSVQNSREERGLPTEGLALYFILDQSGSMQEEMQTVLPGGQKLKTRLDVLKYLTGQFIRGNAKLGFEGCRDDLIGLISFARIPKILSPLTLDHERVRTCLDELDTVKFPEDEGTAIGYAVYKTAHTIAAAEHFAGELSGEAKPSYEIRGTAMILVTDGLQNANVSDKNNPLRNISLKDAAFFAKERGIKLYIINVEPLIALPQYREEYKSLEDAAFVTGGQFFLADGTHQLHEIYRVIHRMEKSRKIDSRKRAMNVEERILPPEDPFVRQVLLYPYLISAGMFLLLGSIIAETTYFGRIP